MGNICKTSPGGFICSEVDRSLGFSCSVGELGVVSPLVLGRLGYLLLEGRRQGNCSSSLRGRFCGEEHAQRLDL